MCTITKIVQKILRQETFTEFLCKMKQPKEQVLVVKPYFFFCPLVLGLPYFIFILSAWRILLGVFLFESFFS